MLRYSSDKSNRQAQTQGDSELTAVADNAEGSNSFAVQRRHTILAISTQFDSQKVLMLCKF